MADGGPSRRHSARFGLAVEIVRRAPGLRPREGRPMRFCGGRRRAAFRAATRLRPIACSVTLVLTATTRCATSTGLARQGRADQRAVLSGRCRPRPAAFSAISCWLTRPRTARRTSAAFRSSITFPTSSFTACCICLASITTDDADAERMERVERVALASIGVADPYADATSSAIAEATAMSNMILRPRRIVQAEEQRPPDEEASLVRAPAPELRPAAKSPICARCIEDALAAQQERHARACRSASMLRRSLALRQAHGRGRHGAARRHHRGRRKHDRRAS